MVVEEQILPGVLLIKPDVFGDERGYFLETYRRPLYAHHGLDVEFVQDNESLSRANVLRGLHYQLHHPQGKLVRVVRGAVFDVAVDIRRDSPSFGQWVGVTLTGENKHQLYIPTGFAHGFVTLEDETVFSYKCTEIYHGDDDRGIRYDDPEIGIQWPVEKPLLSDKDLAQPTLAEALAADKLPA